MDRQEIRDRTLQALNESTSSPVFFTITQLNGFIEDALQVIAEEVSDIRRTAYVPMRDGAALYSIHAIAENVMSPYRVTLHEQDSRLQYILMDELDRIRQRWLDESADSPDYWYPVSWDMFGIWPAPITATGYLRVDYLAWPTPLTDDLDVPEFSLETHDAAVLFGIAEGLLHQWDTARALDYWLQFTALWRDRAGRVETNRLRHAMISRLETGRDSPTDLIGNP
jgi:hypothetical protein